MTAVKTINTSQSTISAAIRKWHLIVIGVVVATLTLRKAFSTPEEPQVGPHREWSVLSESSRTEKSDRRCVGRSNQLAYVDCHPDPEPSPVACWERGCCWIPDRQMAAPQCALPLGTNRYVLTSTAKTMDAWTANLTLLKNASAPLPMSESTTVAVTFIAFAYEFARLRIHDARQTEFETPVPPVPQGDEVPIISYNSTAHSNIVSVSPNRFPTYQVATFRVSGGVLDFFIFFGATPAEVTAQYTRFIKKSGMDDPLSLAVLRDIGGGVLRCRSGPGFEQRLVDLTHPAADHEWTRMFEAFHLFEKFNSADVMRNECMSSSPPHRFERMNRRRPTLATQWLEAFRCPSGTGNVTVCPEHARRFPYDVCGTAQLHLSAYSDVRNAYGYLMARMAHRVIARKFGAYPTLATSNDMFPGIGKWNVFWNLTRDEGAGSLTTAILDIQLYSMLGLPYFMSSLCRVEDVTNKLTYNVCSLWLSLAAFLPVTQRVKISSKWDIMQTCKTNVHLVNADIQLYSMLGLPYFMSSLCRVEDVTNKLTYNVCSLWLSLAAFLPVTQRVKISSKWDVSEDACAMDK
ncbi:hypothetical protein HPB50_006119 [Hyalomma asiaticum]|uniref:Uncharacterized protein n=1 Tax=Hyalomma asiaticum TaxID=266040 RepID=A0ACB7T6J9_HYAAI|nr:hypothetical protein HPB50_006119 [Hyalomma asiaticum]